MPSELFANAAITTLSAAINNSQTSIDVTSATLFPALPNFRIRIGSELFLVTGLAGTTWTVTRGIETTTAVGHSGGSQVTQVLTAGALNDLESFKDSLTNLNAGKLLGRTTASSGAVQEITVGSGLSISGTTLSFAPSVTPIAYGGTNASSFTSTRMLYFNGTSIVSASRVVYVDSGSGISHMLISSSASDNIPLTLRAASTSTTTVAQRWENSSGLRVGELTFDQYDFATLTFYQVSNGAESSWFVSMTNTNVSGFGFATSRFFIGNSEQFLVHNSGGTQCTAWDADTIPLTVKGYSSQSAELTQWVDNSSTVLSSIDSAGRYITGTSTPTLSFDSGAGTGASGSVTGNDQCGLIEITTGSSPATSSIIFTLTFDHAYGVAPKAVILTPANANTQSLMSTGAFPYVESGDVSDTEFDLTSTTVSLTASTAFKFWYQVCN